MRPWPRSATRDGKPPDRSACQAGVRFSTPSCPSAGVGVGDPNLEVTDVDLSLGSDLAGLALLVGLLASVMWLLAKTRRSPR